MAAPEIKVPFPGPKTREIYDMLVKYESRGAMYRGLFELVPIVDHANGVILTDVDGNKYLDFQSGLSAINLGHCNPKLINIAIDQLKKVHHTAHLPNKSRADLAKKLTEIAPGTLKNNSKVHFGTSGSEAVEIALRLARGFTKRPIILSFYGAYHGRGGRAALDVTAEARFFKGISPSRQNVVQTPYPYCYRCHFELEYPDCSMMCLKYLERLLTDSKCGLRNARWGVNFVAAIIMEPALGASGYIIPPDGFWQEVRKLCDEFDILLIDDEVQMGWGRSGKMFCLELWGVSPDIMVVGKSITNGVFPLSGAIAKNEIMDFFDENYFVTTFAGNPVACAVAVSMIELLERDKMPERAAEIGTHLLKGLEDLKSEHPLIGCVDGKGLINSIELVKDLRTKKPAPEETTALITESVKRGLILTKSGFFGNRINIVPPLTVKKEQINASIAILDEAIKIIEQKT